MRGSDSTRHTSLDNCQQAMPKIKQTKSSECPRKQMCLRSRPLVHFFVSHRVNKSYQKTIGPISMIEFDLFIQFVTNIGEQGGNSLPRWSSRFLMLNGNPFSQPLFSDYSNVINTFWDSVKMSSSFKWSGTRMFASRWLNNTRLFSGHTRTCVRVRSPIGQNCVNKIISNGFDEISK